MSTPTDEQIEKFLHDLFGRDYMKVYLEDVPKYHAKARKFVAKFAPKAKGDK